MAGAQLSPSVASVRNARQGVETADSLDDEALVNLYAWVDSIPLSRPKRSLARDFADGVLAAEIVQYYHPRLVELHNYVSANSRAYKVYNWNTLNGKVFRKLRFQLSKAEIEAVAGALPGAAERVLRTLRNKLVERDTTTAGRCGNCNDEGIFPETPGGAWSAVNAGVRAASETPPNAAHTSARVSVQVSIARAAAGKGEDVLFHDPDAHELAADLTGPEDGINRLKSEPAVLPSQSPISMHAWASPGGGATVPEMLGTTASAVNGAAAMPWSISTRAPTNPAEVRALEETVTLLEIKVQKLESILRIKDAKITALTSALQVVTTSGVGVEEDPE